MITIDTSKLYSGLIWHVEGTGYWSRRIQKALNAKKQIPPCLGNHDALTILTTDGWGICDSEPLFAKITPIDNYLDAMRKGSIKVRVFRAIGATVLQHQQAAEYWSKHIKGTFYDFFAFPRLAFKSYFFDLSDSTNPILKRIGEKACGLEWTHWCTEGCATAWQKGGCMDLWQKSNPTPYTTEKRVGQTLEEITDEVIIR